jgi:hypothetical protein
MYDDLARTQNPTRLERFVVHALIPSVLLTAALHWSPAVPAPINEPSDVVVCLEERRAGIERRVVFKALVNTRGRVYPSSILDARPLEVP